MYMYKDTNVHVHVQRTFNDLLSHHFAREDAEIWQLEEFALS